MKLVSKISIISFTILFFAGCKRNEAQMAAAAICDCTKEMVEINQKMDELKDDPAAAVLAGDWQKKGQEAGLCMRELEQKYVKQSRDTLFKKEVEKNMEKQCPQTLKILKRPGSTQQTIPSTSGEGDLPADTSK